MFIWSLCLTGTLILTAEGVADAPKKPQITRADLALALQRFESAFLSHRPEGQKLIDANLAFEDVTQNFFRMNFPGAIAKLNDKAMDLQLGRTPTAEEQWLASLKVTVAPPVIVEGKGNPTVRISSMYPVKDAKPVGLTIIASKGDQEQRTAVKVIGDVTQAALAEVELKPAGGAWKGTWKLALELPNGLKIDTGRQLIAVPSDLNKVRDLNAKRIEKLSASDELKAAVATCKARNELLKMIPNEGRSIEFLADYNVLAPEITKEIEAIEAGRNPYERRRGDYWRILEVGSTRIPLRVYVPESLSQDDAAPLVIVLHGAGGDENMFFDAYGQGAIKREADKHGFIVASPATFFFTTSGKNLKPLIDDLSRSYSIDANRVYVVGHSMGGGATAVQVKENADLVAAGSCIAGFRGFGGATMVAPTLVLAAELDAIVPPGGIESGAKAAIAAGLPVEFRKIPDYGHTLVVEAELGHCIEWLLKHQRGK